MMAARGAPVDESRLPLEAFPERCPFLFGEILTVGLPPRPNPMPDPA
jgi:hypothetical protein